jgi:hypothetical protein
LIETDITGSVIRSVVELAGDRPLAVAMTITLVTALLFTSMHGVVLQSRSDRLVLVGLYRLAPKVLDALNIVQPETVVRWHRAGFHFGYYMGCWSCGIRDGNFYGWVKCALVQECEYPAHQKLVTAMT